MATWRNNLADRLFVDPLNSSQRHALEESNRQVDAANKALAAAKKLTEYLRSNDLHAMTNEEERLFDELQTALEEEEAACR